MGRFNSSFEWNTTVCATNFDNAISDNSFIPNSQCNILFTCYSGDSLNVCHVNNTYLIRWIICLDKLSFKFNSVFNDSCLVCWINKLFD